jgi:2-keto-4-pentenoate hydratase/2-oxohepta-3-ene-1,7-dioic acid hydratase in catechol pathway
VRLCTIARDGTERGAVVRRDGRLALLGDLGADVPGEVLGLLEHGLSSDLVGELTAAAEGLDDGRLVDRDTVHVGPLYRRPRKIWGIGLNYLEHAQDLAENHPTEPASFIKGDHTIIGPGDEIELPPQSRRVTAEAELGIVIGRRCQDVSQEDALDYVAGVCPVLDQTAEDILARNPRFLTRSKNFPTFFSFGPELVTLDEVLDDFDALEDIVVATEHNGATHRENVVANMAFVPSFLVSFHSQVMPLFPGDIISTGTPGAAVVEDGDVATCRIDRIGTLSNPVVRRVPAHG